MTVEKAIILCFLFAQTLAAPNRCIESCTTYALGSYQNQRTNSDQLNLDFNKPGNWTEHNEYRTDGGRGKIYEEHGQYVEGPKRVRFYKKNYTSSYISNNSNGALPTTHLEGLNVYNRNDGFLAHNTQQFGNAQVGYNQPTGSSLVNQEHNYSRIHSQHTESLQRVGAASERLEDFGEYGRAQAAHHETTGSDSQVAHAQIYGDRRLGNWTDRDSYKTDGGRGQVYEEQGQYVTGPKTVRYYTKNYTSSYSTSGVPAIGVPAIETHNQNFQREMERLRSELHERMHRLSNSEHGSNIHIGRSDSTQQRVIPDIRNADLQIAESAYGENARQRQVTNGEYGTERHTVHEESQQAHTSVSHPGVYPTYPRDRILRIPLTRVPNYPHGEDRHSSEQHLISQNHQAQILHSGESRVTENRFSNEHSQNVHDVHNRNNVVYPSSSGQVRRYEEQWSTSGGIRNAIVPEYSSNVHDIQRGSQAEHGSYRMHQGASTQASHSREDQYMSGHRRVSGQLVNTDPIMHGADCTQETTEQVQYGSRYHRLYKRGVISAKDDEMDQQNEDLTQQSEDLTQQTDHHGFGHSAHQSKDLTQQSEDLTQQTDYHGFGHSSHQSEDLTQQSEDLTQQAGHLEFGHPTQQSEDLTQQNEDLTQQAGHLEFGHSTQQSEDLTQQGEDLTQQSGHLEFGHSTQQSEDLTQQNEDLTQQAGHLEFGHPAQHSEDLTQQSEDLTQQSGNLEFAHSTQQSADLTQQNEDLTQQTSNLEFGRPIQQSEDLTQQSEDLTQQTGDLEFGHPAQQSMDFTQQSEDLTQQAGDLEFGQQTEQTHRYRKPRVDIPYQSQRDTRQNVNSPQQVEPLIPGIQQHIGNFDQQSQKRRRPTGMQWLENEASHVMNETEDNVAQTQEQRPKAIETGNQYNQNIRTFDVSQQQQKPTGIEYGSQQRFDDLTQQTEGKLELNEYPQRPHIIHTTGDLEFGSAHQWSEHQNEQDDLTQQTGGFDDFVQHTERKPTFESEHYSEHHTNQKYEQPAYQHQQYPVNPYDVIPLHSTSNQEQAQAQDNFPLSQTQDFTQQSAQYPFEHFQTNSQNTEKTDMQSHQHNTEFGLEQSPSDDEYYLGLFPAPKPKPKLRDQKPVWVSTVNMQNEDNPYELEPTRKPCTEKTSTDTQKTEHPDIKPVEIDPEVDINDKDNTEILRGDQGVGSSTHNTSKNDSVNKSEGNKDSVTEENDMNQVNHSEQSSENMSGLDWHYAHGLPDLTNSEGSHRYHSNIHYNSRSEHIARNQQFERRHQTQYQSQVSGNNHQQQLGSGNWHTIESGGFENTHLSQQNNFGYGPEVFQQTQTYNPHQQRQEADFSQQSQLNNFDRSAASTQQIEHYISADHWRNSDISQQSQFDNFGQESNLFREVKPHKLENDDTQRSRSTLEFGSPLSNINEDKRSTDNVEVKLEPRIIEAYGGGPYDASHSEDIFNRVTPNPSATLPPYLTGPDAWVIREKPIEVHTVSPLNEVTRSPVEMLETIATVSVETVPSTEAPTSFWGKVGNKITTTFDKAKEKARGIFG